MDPSIKRFNVDSLEPSSLLPIKVKLCQKGLLDSHLKTNLDFSIKAMEALPAPKRHNASLMVEGDSFLLYLSTEIPVLCYTVYTGPNGPQLYQIVRTKSQLTAGSLSESHFAGHQCQDEIESCMEQAKKALNSVAKTNLSHLDSLELKITCGELNLTYSTNKPYHSLYIQPRRRVYLGKTISVEKILQTKTQLEKNGQMGKNLSTCFQHLLLKSKDFWETNSRFMLQGDGEMVEFVIGRPNIDSPEFYIYTDGQGNAQERKNIKYEW